MFTGIKTSRAKKELVTVLTSRLSLGAENVIARLAFSVSMASNKKMDLAKIEDAQGKEYSSKVLFGDLADTYVAVICTHYQLYKTDKDIPKYIKMHIDDGLDLISKQLQRNENVSGTEFLISHIEKGLKNFQ